MTAGTERRSETDDVRHVTTFGRCSHCSMQVRSDEMGIHLAHAHNIGPQVKKEKGKDRGHNRRPAGDR